MSLAPGPLTEAGLREHVWPRFSQVLNRPGIYLANHSLGRPLDAVSDDLAEFASLWAGRLDDAWGAWSSVRAEFASNIERLVGAWPGSVVHKDSAGQGLRAVLNALPHDRKLRIVTTQGEFDSIDFILRAYARAGRAEVKFVPASGLEQGLPFYSANDVLEAVEPGTDLVVVSMVFFETGWLFPDLATFVAQCHAPDAMVLLDVYHAAGAVPLDLKALDVDFAVGGSYKYLRGGPGAGFLVVNPRHIDRLTTLDTGWFAKRDPFAFGRHDPSRAQGIDGWSESTPPVAALYQARSGIRFTLDIGVDRIRVYGLEQLALLREYLREAGMPAVEPANPEEFGAFAVVIAEDARGLAEKLKAQSVVADARGRILRLCPDLLNSEAGLAEAAEIVGRLGS